MYYCRTLRGCVDWNECKCWKLFNGRVAPFAGAWIEIWQHQLFCCFILVAPFAGAWIEIMCNSYHAISLECRTLRGCVDWNYYIRKFFAFYSGRTLRGCVDWNINRLARRNINVKSHPSRVRGLKYAWSSNDLHTRKVAPFAGAWIEIFKRDFKTICISKSHPSRVRGLK